MADIQLIELPEKASPDGTEVIVLQEAAGGAGSTQQTTLAAAVEGGGEGVFATAAQGALADTAIQAESDPVFGASEAASFEAGDKSKLDGIATGATVGADWNSNVANRPTLGTAAAQDVGAFATAAQGGLADTALQSVATFARCCGSRNSSRSSHRVRQVPV